MLGTLQGVVPLVHIDAGLVPESVVGTTALLWSNKEHRPIAIVSALEMDHVLDHFKINGEVP
jgi:hypothetical protein